MAGQPDLRYKAALGGKVIVWWQRPNYRGQRTKSPQNIVIALLELKLRWNYFSNILIYKQNIYIQLVNKYYCAWNFTGFIIPGACPLIGGCVHRINAPCRVNEVVLFDFGIAVLQNMQYSRIEKFDIIVKRRFVPVL